MKLKYCKLFIVFLSLFGLTSCLALFDVRPRGEDIYYHSYTEAYDQAYEDCSSDPALARQTLAECLKAMDFDENEYDKTMEDFIPVK